MNYQERLNHVIPGGAHTYSRGFDQFPMNAPQILERGLGAYVWDPDGNKYLDYGMALRAVTLGYAEPRVNAAAIRAIEQGNNLTRASMIELNAAELITGLIPGAEMVKFTKNGSNATTAAAKIARAFTGRRYICIPSQQPFFSFDDWFIATTPLQRGIPKLDSSPTLVFEYNDLSSLKRLFELYPNEIAAVMLEPATTMLPCPISSCHDRFLTADTPCLGCSNREANFLHQVQQICRAEGALFILDEMITGFRWKLEGAQSYFGVQPDLSTFGKGMANGFSVAAVTGRREIMEVGAINIHGTERTFLLSTTHGGEMCGLGAFIETVAIYKEKDVCRHLWDYGARLRTGIEAIAQECGVEEFFNMYGPSICLGFLTKDATGVSSAKYRTLFLQEMIKGGVMMPWIAVSLSHGETELDMTLNAARNALKTYAAAISEGVDKYLVGPEVKPVFRKYN
jgi:glutamate-1-semialdehyde 2,1-aminomutase